MTRSRVFPCRFLGLLGFAVAAQSERQLAASGEERAGSNVGKGQTKAADYVLAPDIANQNRDSGGTKIGWCGIRPVRSWAYGGRSPRNSAT